MSLVTRPQMNGSCSCLCSFRLLFVIYTYDGIGSFVSFLCIFSSFAFRVPSMRLAGKSVSEMTYFVSSAGHKIPTQSIINQSLKLIPEDSCIISCIISSA